VDQKPFLIFDKAPGHVGKKSQAELDEWWGKGNWMSQAGKMPDANDGDVAVFPFMKRTTGGLGNAASGRQRCIEVQADVAARRLARRDLSKRVNRGVLH
jgi:hypothetical protein